MTGGGATCRPEVENTIPGFDRNFRQPFQHGGSELTPIWVPDPILSISDPCGVFPVDGRPGVLAECGQSLLSLSEYPVYPFELLLSADATSFLLFFFEVALVTDFSVLRFSFRSF